MSIYTFSESVYTLQHSFQISAGPKKWVFYPDGSGINSSPRPTDEKFKYRLQSKAGFPSCSEHPPDAIAVFTKIIQYAYERNTAVIIYNSPWQPDFYTNYIEDNQDFHRCQQLFVELIDSLQQSYPNLIYLDFTRVEYFNGIPNQDGFYDSHHLTTDNANLLIDAAAAAINQAYQYALTARVETP